MVTYFPSSGEEGWPTAGVVAAATNALFSVILSTSLTGALAATTSPFGYSSSPEEEK